MAAHTSGMEKNMTLPADLSPLALSILTDACAQNEQLRDLLDVDGAPTLTGWTISDVAPGEGFYTWPERRLVLDSPSGAAMMVLFFPGNDTPEQNALLPTPDCYYLAITDHDEDQLHVTRDASGFSVAYEA